MLPVKLDLSLTRFSDDVTPLHSSTQIATPDTSPSETDTTPSKTDTSPLKTEAIPSKTDTTGSRTEVSPCTTGLSTSKADVSPSKPVSSRRVPYDVTKSARYKNSLSALLSAMSDTDNADATVNKTNDVRDNNQKGAAPNLANRTSTMGGNGNAEVSGTSANTTSTNPYLAQWKQNGQSSEKVKRKSRGIASSRLESLQKRSGQQDVDMSTTECGTTTAGEWATTTGDKSAATPHNDDSTTVPCSATTRTVTPRPASKRPCLKAPVLNKTTTKLFSHTPNNYLKGCLWSPDGLSLLTSSRDKQVRIFNVPDLSSSAEQTPVAKHSTANIVYDYTWNPRVDHMSANNCNFLVSCKDSPIQAVNSFTGQTIASYTAFNAMEVLISAFSVCYISTNSIVGGYCNHVRVFDLNRPGKESTSVTVGDLLHQNNNSIVSTLAPHPSIPDMFAAGCYNATVALYSTKMDGALMSFAGPQHGVTQVKFSSDGSKLYCGSRMESEIYSFDTRNTGEILHTYTRDVQTNQRIQFDIDTSESLLVTGNHDGAVTLFDLCSDESVKFTAHTDTVNGVSLHPYWGILATVSGRRHFHIEDEESEDNSLKIWSLEDRIVS